VFDTYIKASTSHLSYRLYLTLIYDIKPMKHNIILQMGNFK